MVRIDKHNDYDHCVHVAIVGVRSSATVRHDVIGHTTRCHSRKRSSTSTFNASLRTSTKMATNRSVHEWYTGKRGTLELHPQAVRLPRCEGTALTRS